MLLVYIMKKSLLSLASIILAWGVFSVSYALDIEDLFSGKNPVSDDVYAQLLNNDEARWYSDAPITSCSGDQNKISIESPIALDDTMYEVLEYRLFLSPYRIDKIKSEDPSVDVSKIITKQFNLEWSPSDTVFTVWADDGLELDTAYYGFVVPINEYDEIWTASKEICFQLSSNMCMLDKECDSFDLIVNPAPVEPEVEDVQESSEDTSDEQTHGAACVGMNLANVSHTQKGNTIILTWTAVDGENVDIAIFNPEQEIYENVAKVKMSDEKYVYTMKWSGEQNFTLTNDCGSVRYKADAAMKTEEKTPDIVTPATGPAENILYIAIAAIILYGAYAIFGRKSED